MALELAAPAADDEVEASPSLGRPEDVMGVSGERRGGMKGRARGMGSYSPSFSIGLASICHTGEEGREGMYVSLGSSELTTSTVILLASHSNYSTCPSFLAGIMDLCFFWILTSWLMICDCHDMVEGIVLCTLTRETNPYGHGCSRYIEDGSSCW